MYTTHEILEQTGIKSGKTLTRWYQAGLIPSPTIGTSPSGRGKVAYWPEEVLKQCSIIRQMVKAGKSLDEIAQTLKRDRVKPTAVKKKRYNFKDASKAIDLQECKANLDEQVWNKLAPLLTRLRDPFELGKKWTALAWKEGATGILQLANDGYNPVWVTDGKNCWVTADFMVSHVLADASSDSALLVVPIRDEILNAFSAINKAAPSVETISPAQKVVVSKGKAIEEREFRAIGRADFKIEA